MAGILQVERGGGKQEIGVEPDVSHVKSSNCPGVPAPAPGRVALGPTAKGRGRRAQEYTVTSVPTH